jgi:nitric oxide reductase NorD protein
MRRRIRMVKRQFEALRPKRELLRRQLDGTELDTDALVRSFADLQAHGEGSERIWMQHLPTARDLAVAVLFDTSRSTESWVQGRQVIDIARETLLALAAGLEACGDDHAIFSFSSVRREKVFVQTIKDFDEHFGKTIQRRVAALRPGFYTRLGAAIRHASARLAERPASRQLLLVITDGKPNDLDHYEGRYGVEDTRMAVREARALGQKVFGVTIDKRARAHFNHMFGRHGHAIVSRPARLAQALPRLYRHLVM